MNTTIKNLAIAAVFCLAGLHGLPQEVNETAATETVQAAQSVVVADFFSFTFP